MKPSETQTVAARAELAEAMKQVEADPGTLQRRLDRLKALVRQEEMHEDHARVIAEWLRTAAGDNKKEEGS